jgi:hypothetical protein
MKIGRDIGVMVNRIVRRKVPLLSSVSPSYRHLQTLCTLYLAVLAAKRIPPWVRGRGFKGVRERWMGRMQERDGVERGEEGKGRGM